MGSLLLWICSIAFWHSSNGLTQLLMSSKDFSQMNSFILTILQGGREGESVYLFSGWRGFDIFWMWGFRHISQQESISVGFTLYMPSPIPHCSKCHVYTLQQEIRAPSSLLLLWNKSTGFTSTFSSSWGDAGPWKEDRGWVWGALRLELLGTLPVD